MKRLLFLAYLSATLLLIVGCPTASLAQSADSLYGVVNVSVCNLRKEGKFTAGMTTQALLGMPVKILQRKGWYEVQTPDDYRGWSHRLQIVPMSATRLTAWNRSEKVVVTAHYGMTYAQPDVDAQPVSDVVAGNRLRLLKTVGNFYHVAYPDERTAYLPMHMAQPEAVWRRNAKHDAASILQTAYRLMGIPYLWAGTSTKGVDCSGYVRTVLLMHDIIIPRDAYQQAEVGRRMNIAPRCSNLQPGDLVFFGRKATAGEKEQVSHVGFYIGNGRFIHSLGDVHIGSFFPESPEYDAYNTGRLLFATRFLPYLNKEKGIQTTSQNPLYQAVQ